MTYGTVNVDSLVSSDGGVIGPNITSLRNRIINGGMVIDQRNAGAAVTNAQNFITDRFLISIVGSAVGRMTAQQSTTAPIGFTNSIAMTVTTTMASPGSNDGNYLQQAIEGYNIADLAWGTASAKSITLSFWVRSSVTGSFALSFFNADVSRVYGALYSVTTADTWEYKTITVPGDTSGTWGTASGTGVRVTWGFAGGATRTTSTGWSSGGGVFITNVTGATNLMATSGATFYVTGVQFEVGTVATSFDYRPYGTELALCQRYYQRFSATGSTGYTAFGGGYAYTTTLVNSFIPFSVRMRASPTSLDASAANSFLVEYGTAVLTPTVVALNSNSGPDRGGIAFTVSGATAGAAYFAYAAASYTAYFGFSAEL
jgi:hypothetical protein